MPTLFISCVSDEFGNYRGYFREKFERPNLQAKIQEDFIAHGGPTLHKLDDYIQNSVAVIHICGDMTGSMVNKSSLEYINDKYKDFASRFPTLQPALEGKVQSSYTQWEAYLAAYHKKDIFVITPTTKLKRNDKYQKEQEQIDNQLAHLKLLRALGRYPELIFSDKSELVTELYRSNLTDILNAIPNIKPVNLPYQSLGAAFKGREGFMKDLHQTLNNVVNSVAGVAIYGLGGIGKTRLVVEYSRKYITDYTAIFFVNANSPELLKTNIANLSGSQVLNLDEHAAQEEEIKYAAVTNWMNQYTGWLLILDNADTPEAAEKVEEVFAQLQQGHVMITTRIDSWSSQVTKKRLDVLYKEDAVAFLLETTTEGREKKENDTEMAAAVADDLGYLALGLEQAKAYIISNESSFENYRKAWQTCQIEVMKWFDKRLMQYHSSVAVTWQTSLSALPEAAATLLNRLAWLAPDLIPKTLLEVEVPDAAPIDAVSAWGEIKRYSLATSTEDKKSFTVHKLVQDVTRNKLDKPNALSTLTETLNWLDAAFVGDPTDVRNWPVLEPLVPHVLSLVGHAQINRINEPTARLMNDVALLFQNRAQFNTAESLMRKVVEIYKESLGENHPNVAVSLNNLAQLLQAINRLQEAEPLIKKALEIDTKSLGGNHPNVARDLNNLAQLLQATNRLQEAEPLMRKALEINKESFGESHPNVAINLSNLAQLLQATNRLQEAEPLIRKALEIDKASFGENHPNVASDLSSLALLLQDTNRLQEAEPLMRKALEIDKESFGENHPNVARDLNNLALLLQATNRLQEAEPLMRKALEINKASFGENHPNAAIDLNNLAQLLQATNRLQEAEPLMRKALEINKASFGENHPNVASDLSSLALLLQDTNRLQEAEPLMRKALEIDKESFGENHPNVARDLNNLALLLQNTNRLQEAEPLMREALEIDTKSLGGNHPNVARDLNNLAQLLQATNRLQEAEPLMRKALEINKESFGENHPNVAINLSNLAQLLQATNRLQEAEPLMREALEIDKASFGENHPKVARDLNNLALLLQNTNRLQEAEPLMCRALEIDEQSFGENHPNVAIDLNNLALLLQNTNRLQEAEPLMCRALEIDEQSFGENHPNVASNLNNLAKLLQATNRLQEAEPLMRRAFIIFLTSLGFDHPNTQGAGNNYIYLLQDMGKDEAEIRTILSALKNEIPSQAGNDGA